MRKREEIENEDNDCIEVIVTEEKKEEYEEIERIEKEFKKIEKENEKLKKEDTKKDIKRYIETHTDEMGHLKTNPGDIITIAPRIETNIYIPGEIKKSKKTRNVLENLHR